MMLLSDYERRDLRYVLAAAQQDLVYPLGRPRPEHEGTVRRLQEWLDHLQTPDELARVEDLRNRLREARETGH